MVETVFLVLLNQSVRGCIILLALFIARPILRRAPRRWSFMLWGVAALRMLCPGLSFFRLRLSLMPSADLFQARYLLTDAPFLPLQVTSSGDPLLKQPLAYTNGQIQGALALASWVWLAVALLLLCFGIISYVRLSIRMADAQFVQPHVYTSQNARVSFVMGVFKRRIILPATLAQEDYPLVIAHEQTHLSRHDALTKLVSYAFCCVFWFNPLVWLAYRMLGTDMEISCDERVFCWFDQSRITGYCRLMLGAASRRAVFCPVAFAQGGVKARVKNLLRKTPKRSVWSVLACLISLCVLLCGFSEPVNATQGYIRMSAAEINECSRWFGELPGLGQWLFDNGYNQRYTDDGDITTLPAYAPDGEQGYLLQKAVILDGGCILTDVSVYDPVGSDVVLIEQVMRQGKNDAYQFVTNAAPPDVFSLLEMPPTFAASAYAYTYSLSRHALFGTRHVFVRIMCCTNDPSVNPAREELAAFLALIKSAPRGS